MLNAKELRHGNMVMVTMSNDAGIYFVSNIGGYKRIFATPQDEKNYNLPVEKQIKLKEHPKYNDEMLVGIWGGARDGERVIESKLRPVKITSELLLNYFTPESKMNFSFVLNKDCRIWADLSNEKNPIWHFVFKGQYISIKYMHTLQNLYFYLNDNTELI